MEACALRTAPEPRQYWNEDVERMPRERLESMQLGLLREHLEFAYRNSPYYKRSFDEAGVSPSGLKSLADLRAFPFVDKKVLRDRQLAVPLLGDLLAVPERDVVYVSASSGSTGVPTLSPFTAQDFEEFQNVQARLFFQAGMRETDRYCHCLNFCLFVGGPDVIGAQKVGALVIGDVAIGELWDAELYDFYGLSDIFGANAGMCRERDGLHLAEDHHVVEVLDPETGAAVPDGDKGELVLTTLRKRARPMIRFRTGDIVTRDTAACPCGRTHARIRIHGRTDDMFIVNGVNVFPSDVEVVVRELGEVTGEYRITLHRVSHLTRFDLEVEKRSGVSLSDGAVADLVKLGFKNRLGLLPRNVTVHAEGTLPRSVHKAKRVVDHRNGA